MDMDHLTTDKLLTHIPADETERWEFKSAVMLTNKGELKDELSKQVSAFANSGGGFILFGMNDRTKEFEPCAEWHGEQAMKDYLSSMVENSVSVEIQDYRVVRVPFSDDGSKAVFLIRINDSAAAPHQARDKVYYYRIEGHTKRAPHFHLELLRRRETKAVLAVERVNHEILGLSTMDDGRKRLLVRLHVRIRNVSFQCASNWGILIETVPADVRWTAHTAEANLLRDGACYYGRSPLLPRDTVNIRPEIYGDPGMVPPWMGIRNMWESFSVRISPLSHNAVGEPLIYGWREEPRAYIEGERLEEDLRRLGHEW